MKRKRVLIPGILAIALSAFAFSLEIYFSKPAITAISAVGNLQT